MAKGLIGAAMLSGLGQGMTNVSNTLGQAAQFVGASMLQRERNEMEMNRLKIMEQAAAAREQRGYDFQRGQAQERIGAEMVLKGQEREFTKGEKDADRQFTREEKQADRTATSEEKSADREITTRGQDITAKHGAETLDVTKRGQDLTAEHGREQIAAQKTYYAAVERHYAAMEKLAQAKTDSARANANKDLSETAKELANLEKAQGQDFMKMAAAENLDDKNRNYLITQANAHFARAKMHLGYTGNDTGSGVQIKDRFDDSLNGSQGTPPPPPPAVNRGEEYLSSKKAETDQRKEDTRREAMAAMNAGTGLISSVDSEPAPIPSTPSMPPMERQRPTGMQQPGEFVPTPPKPTPTPAPMIANVPRELPRASSGSAEQFLQEKRHETAQREQSIVQPSGTVVGSSIVSGAPQTVEQETTEPQTTSRSGEQLLSAVPEDKRNYVRAQLQEAVTQLRSGRMTEKQFRASVLLAWASVPGAPDDWRYQANTLADGLISQVREGQ